MKSLIFPLAIACALTVMPQFAAADVVSVDFGSDAQLTGGNYNNVVHTQDAIADLIDSTGASTGFGLNTTGFNEAGPNTSGTTSPTGDASVFDAEATRDSLFGHSDNFNVGAPRPLGVLVLTGLDATGTTLYDFTFFGSRLGVGDNRETDFLITGGNSLSGVLNPSNNESDVLTLSGLSANLGSGDIVINVSAGSNNNNGSGFYYLGAMNVEFSAVPEPGSACLILLGGLSVLCKRRRRN